MKAVLIVDYISNSAEYTILCTLLVFQNFLLLEHYIICRFLTFFFFFQDNSARCWIYNGNHLEEIPVHTNFPESKESTDVKINN